MPEPKVQRPICDTPVGLNVPSHIKSKLKLLAAEIETLGRKATMQDVLCHLIDSAEAVEIAEAFPVK